MRKAQAGFGLAVFIPLLTSACAIAPKGVTGCDCVRRQLTVTDPSASVAAAGAELGAKPAAATATAPAGKLATEITGAFRNHARYRQPGNSIDSMLFLSGGSQHGAFGAGFLQRWQERRHGTLPDFVVVTGISTGSILATFAFVGDADAAVRGYEISDESELITPYARLSNGKIGLSGAKALVRRGALADLVPLSRRLDRALTDTIMEDVAKQAARSRKLYVGVVNVDTGEAEAIDLTDLAVRWAAAAPGSAARAKIKSCYIAAIIASASAPVAAPPMFIDNREYIDGGARFGVFSDEIGSVLNAQGIPGALVSPRMSYIIVNGTLVVQKDCGTTAAACSDPQTGLPGWQPGLPHRSWSFLDLAQRSEDILTNQIYRFSADHIAARAEAASDGVRFTKIGADSDGYQADLSGSGLGTGTKTCAQWNSDDAKSEPLQFHPRYMRCLIDYGRSVADIALTGDGVDDPTHRWDPDVHPARAQP